MSGTEALRVRQWVSLPGGSCDIRLGNGIIDEAAAVLKGAVGRPRMAALVAQAGASEELVEAVARQLSDAGFERRRVEVPAGEVARTLDAAHALLGALAQAHVTADDLVVAVGDVDALSLASYACAQWCAATPLVMVPTNMLALVEAPATPRGIIVTW